MRNALIIVLLLVLSRMIYAEGTKELMPFASDSVGRAVIVISKGITAGNYGHFAVSTAPEDSRIYFTIFSSTEKVYLGFKFMKGNNPTYVIKKYPSGTIVKPSAPVPSSGAGYISGYNRAILGPAAITPGGYSATLWNPPSSGDYYIEFSYTANGGFGALDAILQYFDCTVASNTNAPITGRVWSKNWFLSTEGNSNQDVFRGKLYPYSDDQIVTEINFNGIRPYFFRVTCNPNGCNNTEPFNQARMSRSGNFTYAQYKIFLNNPDPTLYPTGILGAVTSVNTLSNCDGTVDININVNKSGQVSLLIDINPLPGFQAEDVNLTADVTASATNTISWNGLNGLGQQVPNGSSVTVVVTYINGLTNLPMYDVEYSPSGFIVNLIRPTGTKPAVFWDDTNLDPTALQLNGCIAASGCHTWSNFIGNENTLNTWWYSLSTTLAPLPILYKKSDMILLNQSICPGDSILFEGVYYKTAGVYTHIFTNFTGCDSTRKLTLAQLVGPLVNLGIDTIVCYSPSLTLNAPINPLTPYSYLWNTGQTLPSITVSTSGSYSVLVTAPNGCRHRDQIQVTFPPAILPKPIRHF